MSVSVSVCIEVFEVSIRMLHNKKCCSIFTDTDTDTDAHTHTDKTIPIIEETKEDKSSVSLRPRAQ